MRYSVFADILSVLQIQHPASAEFRQTVVMITHNNDIARLADRIVRVGAAATFARGRTDGFAGDFVRGG